MLKRTILATLIVAGAALAPAASFADNSGAPCILREHRVTAVKPYSVEQQLGHTTVNKAVGAELYVPAEPGLTAEWLRLELSRHIAQMRGTSMTDCPFDLSDVKVEVDSAGPGFTVKLITQDSHKAPEVLRRARLMAQQ